jgi:hypothetical protein
MINPSNSLAENEDAIAQILLSGVDSEDWRRDDNHGSPEPSFYTTTETGRVSALY